jgi:hypothetical protein
MFPALFVRVDIFGSFQKSLYTQVLFMEVDIPVLLSRNHISDHHCLIYYMFL